MKHKINGNKMNESLNDDCSKLKREYKGTVGVAARLEDQSSGHFAAFCTLVIL